MGFDEVVKRGRGRPKKETTRNRNCNVRLNNDQEDMIEYFIINAGKNKSDIIREAIALYFNINKNKY